MNALTSEQHDYWDSFYASRNSNEVPEEPSAFARWVNERLPARRTIAEFGFGTARDSLWLTRQGHAVQGYDFAETAVSHAQGRANRNQLEARFSMLDLYDAEAVDRVGKALARSVDEPVVYGRFLIHSLEDLGRQNLLALSALALGGGGELCLEFRTGKDAASEHLFGDDHFRIYLDPAEVESEIEERGGIIMYSEAGHGLAVYKTEDPHVARIVARWTTE